MPPWIVDEPGPDAPTVARLRGTGVTSPRGTTADLSLSEMPLTSPRLHTVAKAAGSKGLEMLPPLLLAGLAAGAVARLKVSILAGVAFALASGLIVGVIDGSLLTFFGGVGLGAANFVAGLAFGRVFRWTFTRDGLATR